MFTKQELTLLLESVQTVIGEFSTGDDSMQDLKALTLKLEKILNDKERN